LAQSIADCLGHRALGQQLLFPHEEPQTQICQHWRRALLRRLQTFRDESVPDLPLDCIERTHQLDRFPRDLRSSFLRLDDFATQVCPTSGTRDLVARNDAVVAAISVRKQYLTIVFQKVLRPVTAPVEREVKRVVPESTRSSGLSVHFGAATCIDGPARVGRGSAQCPERHHGTENESSPPRRITAAEAPDPAAQSATDSNARGVFP
jgi:hypothetical protein